MKILKFLVLTLAALTVATWIIFYEGDIPKDVVDAKYQNPSSQFVNLDDAGLIHFRDEGRRRNTAIVLVHGFAASLHTFEPWSALLRDQYRVISLDLPGFGLTGEVPGGDYSTQAAISVLDAVVAELGVEQFFLAGNSMGGGVALEYTLQHPEKVLGLVLIDSGGLPASAGTTDTAPLGFQLMRQSWFQFIAEKFDPYLLVVEGLNVAYNNSPVVTDDVINRYYHMLLRRGSRQAILARTRDYQRQRQTPDISQIWQPTLIMWGMEDAVIPFDRAAEFEKLIPQAQTAYYAGIGHIPMEEMPAQSAADLRSFMEQALRDRVQPDQSSVETPVSTP